MGNASARDWDPIIGKRFNPLETVNTHTTYSTPVLRFAIAYGMQTIQRALQSLENFDYLEAMACPAGCLNGGGQDSRVGSRDSDGNPSMGCRHGGLVSSSEIGRRHDI